MFGTKARSEKGFVGMEYKIVLYECPNSLETFIIFICRILSLKRLRLKY